MSSKKFWNRDGSAVFLVAVPVTEGTPPDAVVEAVRARLTSPLIVDVLSGADPKTIAVRRWMIPSDRKRKSDT